MRRQWRRAERRGRSRPPLNKRVAFGLLRSVKQVRQRCNTEGYPPRFVAREPVHHLAPAGLVLEIDMGERLAVSDSDAEAFGVLHDLPRRREAAARMIGHDGHLSGDDRGGQDQHAMLSLPPPIREIVYDAQ
jgi:hypothetical protein